MTRNRLVKWVAAGMLALGVPAVGLAHHVSLPAAAPITVTPIGLDARAIAVPASMTSTHKKVRTRKRVSSRRRTSSRRHASHSRRRVRAKAHRHARAHKAAHSRRTSSKHHARAHSQA